MEQELYKKLLNAACVLSKIDDVDSSINAIHSKIKNLEEESRVRVRIAERERKESKHDGT